MNNRCHKCKETKCDNIHANNRRNPCCMCCANVKVNWDKDPCKKCRGVNSDVKRCYFKAKD